MTSVLIFPYRTPSAAAIGEPIWTINGSPPESVDLTGVDYYASIEIGCSLLLDIQELERSTKQAASALEFVLIARSESVGLFSVLSRAAISANELFLTGSLRASDAGDLARLQLQLVRTGDGTEVTDKLAARHSCAILWSRMEKLRLSGVGARLSVQAVDFSHEPVFRDVLWEVDLDRSDPLASVSSAAQVRLNSRHPELITQLQSVDEQGLAARIVRRQLQLDVARQFVFAAREFEADGEEALAEMPYDAVGATAIRFAEKVRKAGGLRSRSELWSFCESNPAAFEKFLQAAYLAPALETQ